MSRYFQKGHAVSEETREKIGAAHRINLFCKCAYCENEFKTIPSKQQNRKRGFCSRACFALFRRDLMTKEEHPRFGKGMSKSEVEKRADARAYLNHAVRDGRAEIGPCEICSSTKDIEGHHSDYSKPLQVNWLCRKHHRALHKALYQKEKENKK